MGVFDQAARYVAKRRPSAFFAWQVPGLLAAWEFRAWHDTSRIAFPGEPDRICDTVAEFVHRADPDRRCLLDVEFQTEPDPDSMERCAEYAVRLRRELRHGPGQAGKYLVVSVLLNLTGPEQPRELDLRLPELGGVGHHLGVVLCTLREQGAAATLARIATGELDRWVLPWIPLMRGAEEAGIIEEWKRLAEQEPDGTARSDFGGLALVFAELTQRGEAWRRALRGWNMRQSQQVLEWQEEARHETRIERARRYILRALQKRFQGPVPADLTERIESLTDLDELDRWFDASQTADSLAAFRAAVQA
jgi:hypothetical protein